MIKATMKKILPFLSEHIPPELAEKGINKISPYLGKFLKNGVGQGLTLAGGLNFLRQQFGKKNQDIDKSLRPDEQATMKHKQQNEQFGETLKNVGQLGLTVGGAGPAAQLAGMGAMALGSMKQDENQQIQPQLENNTQQQPEQKPEKQEERNIIQKYAPHLHDYIKRLIQNGNSPMESALKAKKFLEPKDQKIISQMEKDYKMSWVDIVQSIFGMGETALPQSQAALQPEQMQQPQPQAQGQGQQPQNLSPNLLSGIEASLNLRKKYGNR